MNSSPHIEGVTGGKLPQDQWGHWLTPGRFALCLGVLVVAAFPGVLLGRETFAYRDFGVFSYPVAFFHRESFWRGELPLWNPFNHCGVPFLAQWNTMTLYPPTLIYLLLPLTWSLPFFCLAHLFWGGLGMYFLARLWTGNCLAAGVAGVIFAFNGLMLNFLMWPSHAATFAWLPWVLWLLPEGWRVGGRKLVWGILAASLQMLAGGPETILFTWLVLLLLACVDTVRGIDGQQTAPAEETGRRAKRVLWPFLISATLVALICAAQLLPFLQLLLNSDRDKGTASAGYDWSMPIWGCANLLVPLFRMYPDSRGVFFQLSQNWTTSYYAGAGTIALAVVALRLQKGSKKWILAGLAATGVILALGDQGLVYTALHKMIPTLGFIRYPVKFLTLTVVALPLLAAVGIARLQEESQGKGTLAWAGVGVLLLVVIIVAVPPQAPGLEQLWTTTLKNGLRSAVFAAAEIAILFLLIRRPARAQLLGLALLAVCWMDFLTHVPAQNPTVPPAVYEPGLARRELNLDPLPQLGSSRVMLAPFAEETLRLHPPPHLDKGLLANRFAFFANCNLLDDVPQVYGFFSMAPREAANITSLPYVQTNRHLTALLDFMGVSQTTAPGELIKWTPRKTAMPLITAGQHPLFGDEQRTLEGVLGPQANFRQNVFLPQEAEGQTVAVGSPAARVLNSRFDRQTIEFETESARPTMAVVSQAFYPTWRAYVDGKPTRIWRANYAFQAVEIPTGKHHVRLVYEDTALRIGCALSVVGLLACGGLWFGHSRSRKCSQTPVDACN